MPDVMLARRSSVPVGAVPKAAAGRNTVSRTPGVYGRRIGTWAFEVLLIAFMVLFTLEGSLPLPDWTPQLVRILGVILVLAALRLRAATHTPLRIELRLLVLFLFWSLGTGVFASDSGAALRTLRLVVQEVALFFAVAQYVETKRDGAFVFGFVLAGALALGVHGLANSGSAQVAAAKWERMTSVYTNPNALGIACVYGMFGVGYLLYNSNTGRFRPWIAPAIPLLVAAQLRTGARLSLVGIAVYALAWVAFTLRGIRKGAQRALIVGALALSVFYVVRNPSIATSVAVQRLRSSQMSQAPGGRDQLYVAGWRAFLASPLYGGGLGNFALTYGEGAYTHSDFMEVLASTGLVGFVLYMAVYVLLWRRLSRCRVRSRGSSAEVAYRLGSYKAALVGFLFLSIGNPSFLYPPAWVVLGAIVGHSHVLEESMSAQRQSVGAA
jgi:O-antigen ligase